MSYRNGIAAFAIAAVTLAPSIASAQAPKAGTTTQKPDDSTLDNRIEARIKADATLKKDDIDVAVDHGVVTLSGKVHSKAQRAQAERLATIAGVTRVDNKLEVETAATSGVASKTDKAMDKAEDKTEKAKDKADAKADKAKDKTASGASDADEAITDAWITTKVKTQFVGEDALKGSDINVDTNDHVVTLKGTVASVAGRERAMQIAKATKGVTRVIDNLTISPKK
jgi:osmotically-inducible protein OsmY